VDTIGPDNQLLSDGTYEYQYDNNGNLVLQTTIADGSTRSFTWDDRNRLVGVVDKNGAGQVTQTVSYTYDALNRRISESVTTAAGTTVTYFVYDGSNVLLEFQTSPGAQAPVLTEHNLYGPAVDQILAEDDGAGHVSWLLADQFGTIRDVLNNAGTVVDHLSYDAFGNLTAETNSAASTSFRFQGRQYDPATGLYDFGARYYNSRTGTFLSQDPLGFGGGSANLMSFPSRDPASLTDPSGEGGPSAGLGGVTIGPVTIGPDGSLGVGPISISPNGTPSLSIPIPDPTGIANSLINYEATLFGRDQVEQGIIAVENALAMEKAKLPPRPPKKLPDNIQQKQKALTALINAYNGLTTRLLQYQAPAPQGNGYQNPIGHDPANPNQYVDPNDVNKLINEKIKAIRGTGH
jgi:RHS repeat-associated protein